MPQPAAKAPRNEADSDIKTRKVAAENTIVIGSRMAPPPRKSNDYQREKDSLLRPKTLVIRPIAKMAPMEVWENQIIAPLQYMTENAKIAKAVLLAQNDIEANIEHRQQRR